MRDQAAQQHSLGGDPDVPLPGDLPRLQVRIPSGPVREVARALAELPAHGLRELLPLPVGRRHLIDHVIDVRPTQDLQEVQPALVVGALERGEQIVADVGAVAVSSLVPRPRVVDLDVSRDLQTRRQQLVLLPVERLLLLSQDPAELAGGDRDAQLEQLLQEQRLGDVLVVILVEDETDQVRPEVAAGDDVVRQGGDQGLAVGGLPAFAAVAGDLGAEDQVLDDEVLVPFEGRLRGYIGDRDDDLVGDDQLGGLGSLGGPGSFLAGLGRLAGRSFEATGSDHGTRFQALEASDFVFELLDAFLLGADDLEQLSHERRGIGFRDVG
jgi:hypothetical protein